MQHSSREFLELVSKYCSNQLTYYTYNKQTLRVSDKYRRGRVTALQYIEELTFFYFRKEKYLKEQFIRDLRAQLSTIAYLDDNDYRAGIDDAITNVLSEIEGQ